MSIACWSAQKGRGKHVASRAPSRKLQLVWVQSWKHVFEDGACTFKFPTCRSLKSVPPPPTLNLFHALCWGFGILVLPPLAALMRWGTQWRSATRYHYLPVCVRSVPSSPHACEAAGQGKVSEAFQSQLRHAGTCRSHYVTATRCWQKLLTNKKKAPSTTGE